MRATAAAAVGPGGGGGNVIKEKLLKYKEKTEMREIPKKPSLTHDLRCIFTFLPKTYNDPRVDTHLLVVGFRQNHC